MKYYINKNKEIFGFELDGSQDHLITKDMKPISLEEIDAINAVKEDKLKQTTEYKIAEAKLYLSSTDYKMTADYDKDVTDVRIKRAEARAIIRSLEVTNGSN